MTTASERETHMKTPQSVLCLTAIAAAILALVPTQAMAQMQVVDPEFEATVTNPAYASDGPLVGFDEAHRNFHTSTGQYKPFADLITSDGFVIRALKEPFTAESLRGLSILVIANANAGNRTDPAFTEEECDAVREWVRGGGSLLLIADHAPFGSSARNLAARFDIEMGDGWVLEPRENGMTTQIEFTRDSGRLADHAITRGRDESERVNIVRSFTGQSLSVPDGAVALMRLSEHAREAANTDDLNAEAAARRPTDPQGTPGAVSKSVAGLAQGLAMEFGKGRVVVLGEAAMFSAQVVTLQHEGRDVTIKAGMNVPGNDNRQFALNVMHWLSRLLP